MFTPPAAWSGIVLFTWPIDRDEHRDGRRHDLRLPKTKARAMSSANIDGDGASEPAAQCAQPPGGTALRGLSGGFDGGKVGVASR